MTSTKSDALSTKFSWNKKLLALVASLALVVTVGLPAQAIEDPTIGSFSPAAGKPGDTVTINGTNFVAPVTVKFGNVLVPAGDVTIVSDVQITAKVPTGSGQVDIVVSNADGFATSATKFSYAPTISQVSPASGPVGGTNTVVITGANFFGLSGAAAVKFGVNNASSYSVNSTFTEITAVVPAGVIGSVPVEVTATGGTGTKLNAYGYLKSPPTITSLSVKNGILAGGNSVVIRGTNFFGLVGASAVKFGENNATSYSVNTAGTQITAEVPAGAAGTVAVIVSAVDGTATATDAYTYRDSTSAVSASARILFVPGRSEVKYSQYAAIKSLVLAAEGKNDIKISITSRRHSSVSSTLGKARITSVRKILELVGFEGADVRYTTFTTRSSSGTARSASNNRVTVSVSWTN